MRMAQQRAAAEARGEKPFVGRHETILNEKGKDSINRVAGTSMTVRNLKPIQEVDGFRVMVEIGKPKAEDEETQTPDAVVLQAEDGGLALLTGDLSLTELSATGNPGSGTFVPVGEAGVTVLYDSRRDILSVTQVPNAPRVDGAPYGKILEQSPVSVVTEL
jgi:hypothetical protein